MRTDRSRTSATACSSRPTVPPGVAWNRRKNWPCNRRFDEAVRNLGSLLDTSEDYFFKAEPTDSVYRSLKGEAGNLIAGLPAEGRESYELQFGAKARRFADGGRHGQ